MSVFVVIGGGAAGMMAAIAAASHGQHVLLLERNQALGRKLLLTGKGRCNLTNVAPIAEIVANIPGNGRFLYSALHAFDNQAVWDFFTNLGVPLKVERGGRIFPHSDRARDVVTALTKRLQELGVDVRLGARVKKIEVAHGSVSGVVWQQDGQTLHLKTEQVLIATGGAAYPGTGSTGDGYTLAAALGHTLIPIRPALVPLQSSDHWPTDLAGLTLKNVLVRLCLGAKVLGEEFGELLFTHFGVSGPTILTLSRLYPTESQGPVWLSIDLKPALSVEQLAQRLNRDLAKYCRKQFANALADLLPQRLIPVVVDASGIPAAKSASQITSKEREELVRVLKGLRLRLTGPRPLTEALVTAGGVCVREVEPKTMQSKKIRGLYFAGEVLDIDGLTGGYNLQAAFSTGWVAGVAAAGAK